VSFLREYAQNMADSDRKSRAIRWYLDVLPEDRHQLLHTLSVSVVA
jgi:hypothetical protein